MPAPTAPLKFEHLKYWVETYTAQYAIELAAGDMTKMDVLELAHTAADQSIAECTPSVPAKIKMKIGGGKKLPIRGKITVAVDPTNGINPAFFDPVAELAKAGY